MKIQRAIREPVRSGLSWPQRWEGNDRGLVACWECGREKSLQDPTLASEARDGQLVVLPWKGGVEKATKKQWKYGTHFYLAMWQGLRGDDLDIDTDEEPRLICTVTNMTVIFTSDPAKYAGAEEQNCGT